MLVLYRASKREQDRYGRRVCGRGEESASVGGGRGGGGGEGGREYMGQGGGCMGEEEKGSCSMRAANHNLLQIMQVCE